jgi:hypothetical protein
MTIVIRRQTRGGVYDPHLGRSAEEGLGRARARKSAMDTPPTRNPHPKSVALARSRVLD